MVGGNHASAGYLLSSSYTAADVLNKIKTVDGAGSGLDADLLDGNSSAYFQPASSAITTSNIGSQSVSYASSAGNADTTDGLHVHTGRNNSANQIVRTDGNGYIQCGYINSSNGNEGNNSNPARVWGTNGGDDYLRTYLTSALNVNYANTAGRAYPRRSDGGDLNFYWSGQGGQPVWLWGGNDGVNMYVWNPSNFSVNYATTSNNGAKAWVNFNGTGTVAIRRGYNVSSITDNGTGDYTVNFTTAMPDANYCAAGFSARASTALNSRVLTYTDGDTKTASAFQFSSMTAGATSKVDIVECYLQIFH